MLSYQHMYHAGNLADVHKHAALAWALDYLTRKDKPLSYIETHAGRGLYDLSAPEPTRTGEAKQGIVRAEGWFAPDHPYRRALAKTRAAYGPQAYPGSPLIAQALLRAQDQMNLAELHPQEYAALQQNVRGISVRISKQDGFEWAHSLCPPVPRRGLLLIDPSYEVRSDYERIPAQIASLHKKWNVGVVILWYPILTFGTHMKLLADLQVSHPNGLRHEVRFPPARDGHRMIGSGLFMLNPPYGMEDACSDLSRLFGQA